jgi:chemotaxis protein methyltransferase CheR
VEPIAVLVVDDSVVIRRIVTNILSEDDGIRVVGTAASGRSALEKIERLAPDILTLDIEMPEMDGLETLRHLRQLHPRLPVVMFSTLTERAAAATLEALSLGARDYVTKPGNVGSTSAALDTIRSQLLPKIEALVPRRPRAPAPAGVVRLASARLRPVGTDPHGILAIGSSTGGPDALATIVRDLPADLPAPVVVVQHMPPTFTRVFAQRLDRLTRLTVVEGQPGMRLEPGLVMVAPGDTHLLVVEERDVPRVATSQGARQNGCRRALPDGRRRLRWAGARLRPDRHGTGRAARQRAAPGRWRRDRGPGRGDLGRVGDAGCGRDGRPGRPDPATARDLHRSRQRAPAGTRRRTAQHTPWRRSQLMTIAPADFAYVRELVHRRSAIALEAGKEYLVESRLLPIARASGEGSLDRLVSRLRSSPEGALHKQVVEAMTTNETSWFRDRHPYESLESVILPDLLPRRAMERKLTIWSAAAASGQEAYSIAMVLHDRLAADPTWNLRVLATDLSEEMVRRTRAGRYSQLEINRGLPAAKLVRHFTRAGTDWLVNEPLRRMVEARQLNLAAPFPRLPPVDVLFLRNVLIYFKLETRRQILDRVRRVLRPDGYLVLGGAETTLNVDAFECVPLDKATVYRPRGGQAAT